MRDGKLVRSRQRSLSSHFILPRRERPLLADQWEELQLLNNNKHAYNYHARFKSSFETQETTRYGGFGFSLI